MTPIARRGRLLVLAAMWVAALGFIVSDVLSRNFSVVSWLLTAALFYALWRGQRWARWLVVCLSTLAPLVGFYFLRVSPSPLIVLYLLYPLAAAVLLAFPPSVAAFLAFQRTRSPRVSQSSRSTEPNQHVDPY